MAKGLFIPTKMKLLTSLVFLIIILLASYQEQVIIVDFIAEPLPTMFIVGYPSFLYLSDNFQILDFYLILLILNLVEAYLIGCLVSLLNSKYKQYLKKEKSASPEN